MICSNTPVFYKGLSASIDQLSICMCRQNMNRALSLSAVSQAALYVVLFLSGRVLYTWSSRGVALACPAPFHEHHHGHGHHGHHGHHDFSEGHAFSAGLEQMQTTPWATTTHDTRYSLIRPHICKLLPLLMSTAVLSTMLCSASQCCAANMLSAANRACTLMRVQPDCKDYQQ